MARSEQQRQKKLAKQRSQEIRKRQQEARAKQAMTSLTGKMQAASRGEIKSCFISPSIFEIGMGPVFIARSMGGEQLAVGFFLVDAFCLGIKDAGGRICTPGEYQQMLESASRSSELRAVEPATARKLVEGAVAYAQTLGFSPHPDYRKVTPIWSGIDPQQSSEEFTFGRDGKPCYIAGPFDDPARHLAITSQLRDRVGDGNYSLEIPGGDADGLWENEGLLSDDEELLSDSEER